MNLSPCPPFLRGGDFSRPRRPLTNTSPASFVHESVFAQVMVATLPTDAAGTRSTEAADRLGTLFDIHHTRLFRLARRLSRDADEARDLVQDTFLRAARSPR